jgi:F-type H+-transporting ATPase subunit delta
VRDTTLGARYAKGLFLTTEKRGESVPAFEDLRVVASLLAPGSRMGRFFATPEIGLEVKRDAIRKALTGKTLPIVVVFMDLLLRKKRLHELPQIVIELEGLIEKSQGVKRAHLVSAVPLTAAETDRLHRELEELTGGKIKLTSEVDAEVLGGALVRIGDRVIDRTVRTLLDAMGQQLSEANV